MQALCGLQGIFDLFNCKTPGREGNGTAISYCTLFNHYSIKILICEVIY